jgi:cytochrome oxidase Cu insertion factor (SCO1/SenC/PrrC family)
MSSFLGSHLYRIVSQRIAVGAILVSLTLFNRAYGEETRFAVDHPFALTDADGATVTSGDFAGKFLLVYFGYTHCADQCPTALSALVEALDEIGPAASAIQPVFITVDPERDRGPMLRQFTAAFDRRIVGLTGTADQVAATARALHIDYGKVFAGNDDYVIDHSAKLTILGPDRREAAQVSLAEPYLIAAKLIEVLDKGGVPLGDVNNLRAWR